MEVLKVLIIESYLIFHAKLTSSVEISTLSLSVNEIIDEFYSKNSRNVDFIDFGGTQGDLVEKIMENLDNSITLTFIST